MKETPINYENLKFDITEKLNKYYPNSNALNLFEDMVTQISGLSIESKCSMLNKLGENETKMHEKRVTYGTKPATISLELDILEVTNRLYNAKMPTHLNFRHPNLSELDWDFGSSDYEFIDL